MTRGRGVVVGVLVGAVLAGGWFVQRRPRDGGAPRGKVNISEAEGARLFGTPCCTGSSRAGGIQRVRRTCTSAPPRGWCGQLGDPNTAFLSPDRLRRSARVVVVGSYTGVGMVVGHLRDGWVTVLSRRALVRPAERAGNSCGGRPVEAGWAADEELDGGRSGANALRGPLGSTVKPFDRGVLGEYLRFFTLERRDIRVRSVQRATILDDHVGYVAVAAFYRFDRISNLHRTVRFAGEGFLA